MMRGLSRATRPIRQRILLSIGRAVLRRVDEARKLQEVQVAALAGEVLDGVERFQGYGVSSVPIPSDSAEVVLVFVGGTRSHPLALAVEDRLLRPREQPAGDVLLYTDQDDPEAGATDAAHRIQLTREKAIVLRGTTLDVDATDEIVLVCGASQIRMTPTEITIDSPSVRIQGKPDFKGHVHEDGAGHIETGPVWPAS